MLKTRNCSRSWLLWKQWRHWLEGANHHFIVWRDHKNLEYIRKAKSQNSCQTWWALFFDSFSFVFSYRPGSRMSSPMPFFVSITLSLLSKNPSTDLCGRSRSLGRQKTRLSTLMVSPCHLEGALRIGYLSQSNCTPRRSTGATLRCFPAIWESGVRWNWRCLEVHACMPGLRLKQGINSAMYGTFTTSFHPFQAMYQHSGGQILTDGKFHRSPKITLNQRTP